MMKERLESESSRRDFLKSSAMVAAAAGAGPLAQAAGGTAQAPPAAGKKDPYAIAARFGKFLRVTDVTDGLDADLLIDVFRQVIVPRNRIQIRRQRAPFPQEVLGDALRFGNTFRFHDHTIAGQTYLHAN